MWPIIKKEFRENARYLLGAFVIFLVFLDFAAFSGGWNFLGLSLLLSEGPPNVDRADAGAITVAWAVECFFLAGAIAWGQVFQERRRKTWPLLAHLPIPRSRVIFAKVLAGLLMYLVICLPAALLIIARLNTPGVWPGPIYACMFLPLLYFFLSGAMFYLATFLCAFRSARWYATKWFPLVTAIAAYCLVGLAENFRGRSQDFRQLNPFYMFILLFTPAAALLSLALVLWAIREQARTSEF